MIPVNIPDVSGNERKYLLQCIDDGWISSEGPFVSEFESAFAKYVGRDFGTAVSSGSGALDIAIKAAGISEGDEVLVPTFTIISPVYSILRQGAIPVLLESDPITWNVDVTKMEQRITKKTKAIVVIHTYGLPVDMNPVIQLAEKYKLVVIEDAAEVHGLEYNGVKCGNFGDISIFSFYPNKHITTGEGGMILTNSPSLDKKSKELRNLSFSPEQRFVHHDFGWNYRMTNLQAALGLAQLERIEEFIVRKRHYASIYRNELGHLSTFSVPKDETEYADNIYWVYGILFNEEKEKNRVADILRDHKIGTRPFFWCMHEQPIFREKELFWEDRFPVAEKLARNGIYLPMGLGHSEEQIYEVCSVIKSIYE